MMVQVWDISGYTFHQEEVSPDWVTPQPSTSREEWLASLQGEGHPKLLVTRISSWQAHKENVCSVDYVDACERDGTQEMILTASTDCRISLWTPQGAHIGVFNQTKLWDLVDTR